VSLDYKARGSEFTGQIISVQFDVEKEDKDRMIEPEESFMVAMARQ
jgi:hypothetical protein